MNRIIVWGALIAIPLALLALVVRSRRDAAEPPPTHNYGPRMPTAGGSPPGFDIGIDQGANHPWIEMRTPRGEAAIVGHVEGGKAVVMVDDRHDGAHFTASSVSNRCTTGKPVRSALLATTRGNGEGGGAVVNPDLSWARGAIRDGCDGRRRMPAVDVPSRRAIWYIMEAASGRKSVLPGKATQDDGIGAITGGPR